MIESRTTRQFRKALAGLPAEARQQAMKAYRLFQADPSHPSLHFKKLQGEENIYSARAGLGYRAIGAMRGSRIVWFWIGGHADYDRMF